MSLWVDDFLSKVRALIDYLESVSVEDSEKLILRERLHFWKDQEDRLVRYRDRSNLMNSRLALDAPWLLERYEFDHEWVKLHTAENRSKQHADSQSREKPAQEDASLSDRPVDWNKKPLAWRVIGGILLSQPDYMKNEELGRQLDASSIIKCPYGATWAEAMHERACTQYIQEIRRWVKRPGGKKRVSISSNGAA
jgi:hypothetical protein